MLWASRREGLAGHPFLAVRPAAHAVQPLAEILGDADAVAVAPVLAGDRLVGLLYVEGPKAVTGPQLGAVVHLPPLPSPPPRPAPWCSSRRCRPSRSARPLRRRFSRSPVADLRWNPTSNARRPTTSLANSSCCSASATSGTSRAWPAPSTSAAARCTCASSAT